MRFVSSCRRGFTLIELLVVIGIIGILSGILLTQFTGATESAMSAKCLTNMRNLAVAVYTAAGAHPDGAYPSASSYEYFSASGRTRYERVGWVSWLNMNNAYAGKKKTSHVASASWTPYTYYQVDSKQDRDEARFALTNGTLWAYVGRTADSYVCPKHLRVCKAKDVNLRPTWSYAMNALFGYDDSRGASTITWNGQTLSGLTSKAGGGVKLGADRVLLFAELPFVTIEPHLGGVQNDVTLEGDSPECDCTLQYDDGLWSGTKETIGFNHKSSRHYVAHVAFADGHVASMTLPKEMSANAARELTSWLCQGDEIYFSGSAYERVSKADKNEK